MTKLYLSSLYIKNGRIRDYLSTKADLIERTKRNCEIARRIDSNLEVTLSSSDERIRVINILERSKQINQIDPKRSLDPVYRKINAIKEERRNAYILDIVEMLEIKFETRRITETEYNYLKETPEKQLFDEWYEQTRKKYEKQAKAI